MEAGARPKAALQPPFLSHPSAVTARELACDFVDLPSGKQ